MNNDTATAAFRALCLDTPHPLVLVNAWDAASARMMEAAGAPAIATTSAGVAWSLGRSDGGALTRAEAVGAVRRIVGAVSVPVSADIEGGYPDSFDGVARTIASVIDAGAAGINIEDGTLSPADFADRIAEARRTADRAGVALFINARTDVFLRGGRSAAALTAEAIERGRRYVEAGADGVFVPGAEETEIAALSSGIPAPLNVMGGPGSSTTATLGRLGAARVSVGSSVAQAAYALARRAAAAALTAGSFDVLADGMDYGRLNALMRSA
ncbi:isocitrate lyase/phosphoenolpyruvate mutase family protein [Microbacterium sp. BG28]|uniref:isocitrate lyase/PEP mutase family protein n=1 Tax=Microbacterium sp. BG28 TaxID=3097356 RepID=UPI002A59F691|nr:isocitrate lyase/phosphoenolpyruvate mutase family protein [Microbacterium sp. BG28]MDY0828757.1 isocitrate lyase/phosphoenolpyruvate mutase family protein [Microbacterium sp. BG28]